MTPLEILEVVTLALAVITCACLAIRYSVSVFLDALSADAALDPVRQPRCSTLPEPTDRHALLIACLLIAVVLLGLVWSGYGDGVVRWVVG
jgi:TRAP-type C4-dicarboxylate transport system permease small subunit